MKAILAALTLIALASASHADEGAEFHCPKAGTVLVFNGKGSLTFTEQDGFTCVAKSGTAGKVIRRYLGIGTASWLAENHLERLFPLKVGNEIEVAPRVGDSSHLVGPTVTSTSVVYYRHVFRVLRQERLETKAGGFETYVIEDHLDAYGSKANGAWVYTYWWAPELGHVVKETHETRMGYGDNDAYEITSITRP